MQIKNKIKGKISHGLAIQYLLDRLSAVGIGMRPFFLVQEGIQKIDDRNVTTGINPCEATFLSKDEVRDLAYHPEVGHAEKELISRLDKGCKCFGLKHHSKIIAYMWCNFSLCESWISFSLKPKEVYLFDARVFKDYRGNNLAPYLRNQLYKELRKMNFNIFYSITDAFNTPAYNFKKKIGAKNLKLLLKIQLFKLLKKTISLKDFSRKKDFHIFN